MSKVCKAIALSAVVLLGCKPPNREARPESITNPSFTRQIVPAGFKVTDVSTKKVYDAWCAYEVTGTKASVVNKIAYSTIRNEENGGKALKAGQGGVLAMLGVGLICGTVEALSGGSLTPVLAATCLTGIFGGLGVGGAGVATAKHIESFENPWDLVLLETMEPVGDKDMDAAKAKLAASGNLPGVACEPLTADEIAKARRLTTK